ncbi:hypothetical protein [Streptomyces abikoensis]|uniref:Uncharacterized protein n=1 Tax=Streptomyces abikoensis TaxID=97398 RepID=A0ABW7TEJ1_9ACTN
MSSPTPDSPHNQGGPSPQVMVELVSGEHVAGELLAWIRQRSGDWWCELRITLWAELRLPGGEIAAEPKEVTFRAPARLVSKIGGTDYSRVPRRRVAPPSLDQMATEFPGRWSLQDIPSPPSHKIRFLHYEGCLLANREPTLTLDQARRALVEGAQPCDCGSDRLAETR